MLLLEQSETFVDRVRGEWISPWGVAEVKRVGLYDLLMGAGGHHLARHVTYHETLTPEQSEAHPTPLGIFVEGVPVNVRYDRLVKHGDAWTILDWKTGRVRADRFGSDWQTRLYRLALVEAGAALGEGPVLPEAVTLVYWEVSTGTALSFGYDADSWRKDRAALSERVAAAQQPFDPHLPDDPHYPRRHHHCGRCLYDTLCNLPADDPGAATRELRVPKFG